MKKWALVLITLLSFTSDSSAQLQPEVVVSFNSLSQHGRNNRDSVFAALARMGVPFDSIDRNANDSLDYTPWQTLVWASGDPNVAIVPGAAKGQAGLSAKEIQEVENFLHAGTSICKKDLVIAGQNIAYEHDSLQPNGAATDTTFLKHWLHVKWIANAPTNGEYRGWMDGEQPAYWKYSDSLVSTSPDVITTAIPTDKVGPEVNELANSYRSHPSTPFDSGAGVSYYNPSINTVFYAFDWADIHESWPLGLGDTTSGVTRLLAGAFAFFLSHFSSFSCASGVTNSSGTEDFAIEGIYPNPAEDEVEIQFSLIWPASISVCLVDAEGRPLLQTAPEVFAPGDRMMKLDLPMIPSGTYLCRIQEKSEANSATIARILSIRR